MKLIFDFTSKISLVPSQRGKGDKRYVARKDLVMIGATSTAP
jgi:hypothetical protein